MNQVLKSAICLSLSNSIYQMKTMNKAFFVSNYINLKKYFLIGFGTKTSIVFNQKRKI